MTAQELRNAVLQLAIQGKLVEQRAEEGTAEELCRQIQREKAKLIREGKLKKEKPLPEIAPSEHPFDIPEGWKWVRWGDISESIQYGYNAPAKSIGAIRMVRISDIQDGNVLWETVPYCDITEAEIGTYLLKKNDILFARTGGTVGKSFLVNEVPYESIYAGYLIRTRYSNSLCSQYLKYFMDSQLYWQQLRSGTIATAQPNCNGKTLANMVLPLPPLAEQRRIVAKLEEILPLIDRYEAARERLNALAEETRSAVLQLAIQGRLTEQRAEDGTAEELYRQIQKEKAKLIREGKLKKEKPLPEIEESEQPFDIPKGWKWVRLRSLGYFSSGKTPAMNEQKYWKNATVPWITSKDMKKKYLSTSELLISRIAADEMQLYPVGTMLMVVRSGILKRYLPVAILTAESTINQDIKAFSLYMPELAEYVYAVLKGMEKAILREYRKQVTTVDSLRFEEFQDMVIPLPPLAEQRRIVAKLEEILPLIDRLTAR